MAVVGEAPGFQEGQTGIPFTGPSGKLLDASLQYHGFNRSEVSLTNVCLCRPPDNRTPTRSEIAACSGRLQAELQELAPKQIVALGSTATQALTGSSQPITRQRVGPPRRGPSFAPGSEVIPTFHPAYCLRSQDQYPHLLHDLGKLRPELRVNWEPPTYKVFDDESNALQVLALLHRRNDDELTVDIETGLEKDFADAHVEDHTMLCVGIGYETGRVVVIGEQALMYPSVQRSLGQLLEARGIVAHNGKFDLSVLQRYGRGRLVFDTMLASYCLDERPGTHGLKYLAVELLGAPKYDDEVTKYVGKGGSYANIPRDKLYRYNAFDVGCTQLLRDRYRTELENHGLGGLNDFLTSLSPVLQRMEARGLSVDIPYLDYLTDHYLEGLDTLERQLDRWVANPRSPQQVKRALEELGVRNVATTNADMLEHLLTIAIHQDREELGLFCELMLKHRREQKLYGTYVKGTRKRLYRGSVYPTFLLHGTTTGRQASRNPNLFNVPRESSIRRMFVPREGHVYVQADYATIELRVLATLARDEYLRGIFAEGRDIHNEFSTILYGPGFNKEQRVRTKAFVYGVSYGREALSIALEYGIPRAEAQKHMDSFLGAVPDVVRFRKEVKQQALHGDTDLITHFGRHRRYYLVTRDNMRDIEKEAYAFYPQSTAADICHHALLELDKRGFDLRLSVYDSIMAECPTEDAEDVAREMSEVMKQVAIDCFTDYVPFPVDCKIGTNWGDV